MKIGAFSDPHYCHAQLKGKKRPLLAFERVREAMEKFKEAEVDICVCLGDLTDRIGEDTKEMSRSYLTEILGLISSYGIPFYLSPGNHDYLMTGAGELEELGIEIPPYKLTFEDCELIFLDSNYDSRGRRYDEVGADRTDSNIPNDQLDFLRDAVSSDGKRRVLLLHQSIDPLIDPNLAVKNAAEVRDIIKGRVELVLGGHIHSGAEREVDGIKYITLGAMCKGECNPYRILTV